MHCVKLFFILKVFSGRTVPKYYFIMFKAKASNLIRLKFVRI